MIFLVFFYFILVASSNISVDNPKIMQLVDLIASGHDGIVKECAEQAIKMISERNVSDTQVNDILLLYQRNGAVIEFARLDPNNFDCTEQFYDYHELLIGHRMLFLFPDAPEFVQILSERLISEISTFLCKQFEMCK